MLPFFSVGFVCLILSALMIVIIPSNLMKDKINASEMEPLVAQTSFELMDPPDTESSGPVDIT